MVSSLSQVLLEIALYVLSEGYQDTPSLTADNSVGLSPLAYNLYEEKPNHKNEDGAGEHEYTNETTDASGRMKNDREIHGTALPLGGYCSEPGGVVTVGDAPPICLIPQLP